MCFSIYRATNCIHYSPGFGALNGYVVLVQRKPVLGRVQASMAPIFRSCFTRMCWKQYGTNIHTALTVLLSRRLASPHQMSSHLMFSAVALSTMRQGQKVRCVQDEAYLVTPGFESSSEGTVCFSYNVALQQTLTSLCWSQLMNMLRILYSCNFSAFAIELCKNVLYHLHTCLSVCPHVTTGEPMHRFWKSSVCRSVCSGFC